MLEKSTDLCYTNNSIQKAIVKDGSGMVYIVLEHKFASSYWCSQYMRGINHEAKRKNIETVTINEASKLESISSNGDIAILIGTTLSWLYDTIRILRRKKMPAVVLSAGKGQSFGSGVSFVSMDYEDAFDKLSRYLSSIDRTKAAFFAPDPDSSIDLNKCTAFLNSDKTRSNTDIYYFNATLDDACRNLYDNIDSYNAVICANHISQVVLSKFLSEQGLKVPDDIHIAFFGDSDVDRDKSVDQTLLRIKAVEAGKLAIRCVRLLSGYSDLSSVSMSVKCDIITNNGIVEFDGEALQKLETEPTPAKVTTQSHISNALMLEKILCNCDRVDIEILESIIRKESYSKIAARVHISENTIGYRIKRLMQFANTNSKEEMINALRPYLN